MSDDQVHEGGCLCGAVRYRVTGPPKWIVHCHCTSCRRASGGAFVTWAGYARGRFDLAHGRLARFASSLGVRRGFCAACGSPLTYEAARYPGEIHVTVASLDRPEDFPPRAHVWAAERLAWVHVDAALPASPEIGAEAGSDGRG